MQETVACDFCQTPIVLSDDSYVHRTQPNGTQKFWHNAAEGEKKCWFKRLLAEFAPTEAPGT